MQVKRPIPPRNTCVANCGQTAPDSDIVTIDSLSELSNALSNGTIADPLRLRRPFSRYRQTTDRTSYHKRDRTTNYGRLKRARTEESRRNIGVGVGVERNTCVLKHNMMPLAASSRPPIIDCSLRCEVIGFAQVSAGWLAGR